MPPEPPLPWDRRDFRRHDRSGPDLRGGGGFGGPNRWREPHAPPYHHQYNRHHPQQHQRWYPDFRSSRPLTPGHGRQGGWHMYADDAAHGFLPSGSRYGDRNFENENGRSFVSRGDGRSFRNTRENRGSLIHKVWKAPSQEPAVTPNEPVRPIIEVNYRRPVESSQKTANDSSTKSVEPSSPLPDTSNLLEQYEEPHYNNGGTADAQASTSQDVEKDNGLGPTDWKTLKWSRSGSLSSRSSTFSRSGSSKSVGVDSAETVAEVELKKVKPVQSSSADVVACIKSSAPAPADDTGSRKKPRLGWGEGLAKFEKKKVDGPEGCSSINGLVVSVGNTVKEQYHAVNLPYNSPSVASLSECASPSTPSSVACSSSPGIEKKETIKVVNVDYTPNNLICSRRDMTQTHDDGPTFNLETLDLATIAKLSTSIDELLQSEEPSSVGPGCMQNTPLNKLSVWKVEALKALEATETEIDSLETEVKSLITEHKSCCPLPDSSRSIPGVCHLKACGTDSLFTARPARLTVSSGDMIVKNTPVSVEDGRVFLKDVDSPGSASSKIVGVQSAGEDIFASEAPESDEKFVILEANNSSHLNEKSSENGLNDEINDAHVDNYEPSVTNSFQDHASSSNVGCPLDSIYDLIAAGNKYVANSASEELSKLLPAKQCEFGVSTGTSVFSLHSDPVSVTEKILKKKRSLQFKKKAITLKFKVFQHFWKDGRTVSVRKLRSQSHKKVEPSQAGGKKNRSSSRSRTSSSAGSARTVPAGEVIEFVNMLLSDTHLKAYRNTLKMPALILDNEIKRSRFISHNGLVEDPCAVEKERSIDSTWKSEEMEIFIDKLAVFGKDFKKIASYLNGKTVADCIEFYYKNHKSQCFERAKRKPCCVEQTKSQPITYLVASGKRRNREMNAASLDMLGAASAIASDADIGIESEQKYTSRCLFGGPSSCRTSRDDYTPLQSSNSLDMCSDERETAAADVLAGICGSVSSEAMGSCITSSVDPGEGYQDWRSPRVDSATTRPLTPEVTQNVDDESSDESCQEIDSSDWTDEEKSIFVQAVLSHGKNFAMVSQSVRTRSRDQCKIFFGKAQKSLGLDLVLHGECNTASDDDGGDSDIEDACVMETGADVCSGSSECKIEDDIAPLNMKSDHESRIAVTQNLKIDFKKHDETNAPCSLDPVAVKPVLKDLSTSDIILDDKQTIDFNVDNKERNGAKSEFLSKKELGNMVVSVQAAVEGENFHRLSNSFSETEKKEVVGVSSGHCSSKNGGLGPLSPEDNLGNGKAEGRDCSSMELSGTSGAVSETNPGDYISHPCFGSDSVKPSSLFTVPVKYQRSPTRKSTSAVGSNGICGKHFQKIARTCDSQKQHLGMSLSDPLESSQILKGYPVSVQTVKGTNGVAGLGRVNPLQNVPRREDGNSHSDRHTDFSLQKCNSLRHQGNVFPSHQEQNKDHSRLESGSSSDAEKPPRKGDVKLFGKILVPLQQKPNSSVQQVDNNIQHTKGQSLGPKFSGDQGNIDASQLKFGRSNYIGSENIPVRSFGFRDGNHLETGYPHFSDSALLLAKYPSAFGSYAMPTMRVGSPSLHGVVRSSKHPSNSALGFPSWNLSSNRDVQPFTIDMKQPQDILLSEMQRRNGFDLLPGMQQQAGGTVGINAVGRGGILVGSQSSGVSDPVAAIKMHYANTEHFILQTGNIIKEENAWRNNGRNIGR